MRNIIVLLVTMLLLVGCQRADSQEIILSEQEEQQELVLETEVPVIEENVPCAVFVCGAVINPGVYYLDGDQRLIDAVEAAGGFTEDADKSFINLAAQVQDGLKLQIPTVAEVADAAAGNAAVQSYDLTKGSLQTTSVTEQGSELININTASVTELKSLPGVGDAVAGRIVDYRTENGNFSRIEDIMKVSGIKDKLFSKIKDRITV